MLCVLFLVENKKGEHMLCVDPKDRVGGKIKFDCDDTTPILYATL